MAGKKSKGANGKKKKVVGTVQKATNAVSNAPVQHGYSVSRCSGPIDVLKGTDFLGTVGIKAKPTTAKERVLGIFPVSPSYYPGTRLTRMADNWERYRFRKFNLRYVPAVPTALGCQVLLYQDTDPSDDPSVITNADALIRQATSQARSKQWNFYQREVISMNMRRDVEPYYTGQDKLNPRFSRQGDAYLLQVTDPVNFQGEALTADLPVAASVYLDWEIEFSNQQINPAAALADIYRAEGFPLPPKFDATSVLNGTQFQLPSAAYLCMEKCFGNGTVTVSDDSGPIVEYELTNAPNYTGPVAELDPGNYSVAVTGNAAQVALVFTSNEQPIRTNP
jgi:hypothetical protein